MKRTPTNVSELLMLAKQMLAGLRANATTLFTNPPFELKLTEQLLDEIQKMSETLNSAKSTLTELKIGERKNIKDLTEMVRRLVGYIKGVANGDASILEKGGLSASEGTTLPDRIPGQCTFFEMILKEGASVKFRWRRPKTGGAVRFYLIERKNPETGVWELVGATEFLEIKIDSQPTGINFEYKVIPTNRVGRGADSNIVSVRF